MLPVNMEVSHFLLSRAYSPPKKSENIKISSDRSGAADTFLYNIDSDDLKEVKQYFFPTSNDLNHSLKEFNGSESKHLEVSITKEEFVNAIEQIFGKQHLNEPASLYFEDLQEKCKIKDTLSWNGFLDSIIDQYNIKKGKNEEATNNILQVSNRFTIAHKKGPILQMIALETDKTFCFVVINFMLNVQVYTHEMVLCHSYNIVPLSGLMRRTIWISSACSSPEGTTIFISTSDRYLFIYDSFRQMHNLKFIISGCPNILSCQKYISFTNSDESMLLLGDDSGSITFMVFHQKSKSFFKESQEKEIGRYTWREIKRQETWVSLTLDEKVHHGYVMDVDYIPGNDIVISCSPDPLTSVVIKKLEGNILLFVVKLKKGIKCFNVDETLGYFATSSDTFVYLWRTSTPHSPVIRLAGHERNLIDLCFLSHNCCLLTLSEDGVLKVWNLEHFKCLQTLHLESSFSKGKIYFFTHKIYKAWQNKKAACSEINGTSFARNVYIINGSYVTELRINYEDEIKELKNMPTKNLEPSIPTSEVIFKNFDRANPFRIKNVSPDEAKRCTSISEENSIMNRKFFLQSGAVYLALKTTEINEDFLNSVNDTLQRKKYF